MSSPWNSGLAEWIAVIAIVGAALPCAASDLPHISHLQQFTSGGHVLEFDPAGYRVTNGAYVLRVNFEGARAVVPRGEAHRSDDDSMDGRLPRLGRVMYPGLWEGIDGFYDQGGGILRSTWEVAPGANPTAIRLRYNIPIGVDSSGELVLQFEAGEIRETSPVAWQDIEGVRRPVDVFFSTHEDGIVGFRVGSYDPQHALTIDPLVSWHGYFGATGEDKCTALARVGLLDGFVVTGESQAPWGSPVSPFAGNYPDRNGFIAKLDTDGTLEWHTFLGAAGHDTLDAATATSDGKILVAGTSIADWGNPVRASEAAVKPYVAKFSSNGDLLWNTFLASSGNNHVGSLAVDSTGSIIVIGASSLSWAEAPIQSHSSPNFAQAFVAKIDPNGDLVWHTFLGASFTHHRAVAVALGPTDDIFVSGMTASGGGHDPTWGDPIDPYSADWDVFVARLSTDGVLLWNTFLGGDGNDIPSGIAIGESEDLFITGRSSDSWGDPIVDFTVEPGWENGFVVRMNLDGERIWNSFMKGLPAALAFAEPGIVAVAGRSEGVWGSWGHPESPFGSNRGSFAAKFDEEGNLTWNTFIGPSQPWEDSRANALAVIPDGRLVVAGETSAKWGQPVHAWSENPPECYVVTLGSSGPGEPYCGDGILDPGEECDDGNNEDGDCCDSECRFEAAGSACEDGDPTTCPDACDGAGTCVGGSDETVECGTCDDGVDNDGDGFIDCEDPNCCTLGEAVRFAAMASRSRGRVLKFGVDVTVRGEEVNGSCNEMTGLCGCEEVALRGCLRARACTRDRDCGGGVCDGISAQCVCPTAAVAGCPVEGWTCQDDGDCRIDESGVCDPVAGECVCRAGVADCAVRGQGCGHHDDCRLPYPSARSLGAVCAQGGDIRAGSQVDLLATGGDMQLGKGRTASGRILDLGLEFASNGDLRNLDEDRRNDCKPGRCLRIQPGSAPVVGPPVCGNAPQKACGVDEDCPVNLGCSGGQCVGTGAGCATTSDCEPRCEGRQFLADGTCAADSTRSCMFDFECGAGDTCSHPYVSTDGSSPNFGRCAALLEGDPLGRDGVSGTLCRVAKGIELYAPTAGERVNLGQQCIVCEEALGQPEATCTACPNDGSIRRNSRQPKTVMTLNSGLQVLDLDGQRGGLMLGGRTQLVLRGERDTVLVVRVPDLGRLQVGAEAKVYSEGIPPEQILWVAGGRRGAVKLSRDVHFVGTILAPERANAKIGGDSEVNGAVFSQRLGMIASSTIRHFPFRAKLPVDPASDCAR